MGIPGPNRRHEFTAVLPFAEIPLFHAFLIHRISFFYLHAGVDNRDQTNPLSAHLLYKRRKVREILLIYGKVLIILHIVNIQINHVDWDIILPVSFRDFHEIFLRLISPTALPEPKPELRRDVASANHLTELLHNVIRRLPFNQIQVQIRRFTAHLQEIRPCIADVKCKFSRIIEEQSKILLPGNHDKIMRAIQGTLIFRVVRLVRTITDITVSPLIQSPVRLAKPINNVIFCHLIRE